MGLCFAAEHRVQLKATRDHPQFTLRAHALVDGAILASYKRASAAPQPTLVLVPETHGDRTQFQERMFLENLPADLPVVIVEARGQGRSWPPPVPAQATVERYASDVLEVVAQLGLTNWFIGGHSLGGMIAIEIAGRRPAGLRGVVALEGWVHSRVQRLAFPTGARTEAQAADARAQREERYRSQRWTSDEAAALPRAWTAWESGERILRETHLPVLSVWGDRGQPRPTRAQLLLPERANIQLAWISDADHYITDSPRAAETARAVSRFVSHIASAPHPTANPLSPLMLAGEWVPAHPHEIDFDALPRIPSHHAIVSDVRGAEGHRVNQHNYLVHHAGRFWAMWSDGPGESRGVGKVPGHDRADQHVSFATSEDGLKWSAIENLTGRPDLGYGWIARGFWEREGSLLALASRYEAPGYHGPGLSLHAFELVSVSPPRWRHAGLVFDDAINNFSPKLLPSGEWMMSRRDGATKVHNLVGGVRALGDWTSFPVVVPADSAFKPEEPNWWVLPDGKNLVSLFRDNGSSGYLFRAFSTDHGRTWTHPVRTNFPDAKSKFSDVRLRDGRTVLVSNPHPKRRDPLTLAISDDGVVFHTMGWLAGGRHVDYPHVIEHGDSLYVAFATAKMTVEVLRVRVADLAAIKNVAK